MKYIDADKLINEINARSAFYLGTAYSVKDTNVVDGLNEALEIIESLQQEQPELDLEKESREGWKPSEEQMNRLLSIVAALRKNCYDETVDFLASLCNDLKKLM